MRLDKLWIQQFKNLKDFTIEFDELQMTTVLIGRNGTGKSNLIEALVVIFRNLDLGRPPEFGYDITYICRGMNVRIKTDDECKSYSVFVDSKKIPLSTFKKYRKTKYLPNNVFAYYSGPSNRLESHFNDHQRNFYNELLNSNNQPLRPLFYARLIHSQFVLLSYFSFEDKNSKEFLEEYLDIDGLESVLFILKSPPWKSNIGDKRFWNARGVVQGFLDKLYNYSLAPIYDTITVSKGYRKNQREEHLYLFIRNEERLKELASIYGDNREFFKVLESTYISELIHEVKIKVKKKNGISLTFKELSEGEQQLITVLGLLKFNKNEESLFLLDEPDTHLNPAWKLKYLSLLEAVVGEHSTSHVIISTHDPLVIGGLTKSQVKMLEKHSDIIISKSPEIDPKGMGVAALLTSEMFGLNSTLDIETQEKLDRKRELFFKEVRTKQEEEELEALSNELESLDFTRTIRDPLYDKFVRAIMSKDEFKKPILSAEDKKKQETLANEIIDQILMEEGK